MLRSIFDRVSNPGLRTALTGILLVVLLPTLGVVAMALLNASHSFRTLSEQRLLETSHILAQSTLSEIEAMGRILHDMEKAPAEPLAGHEDEEYQILDLPRDASGRAIPPADPDPALAGLIRHALRTGQVQVSNILPERIPGERPRIAIIHPETAQTDDPGETVRLVILTGPPDALIHSLARQTGTLTTSILAITDGNGRILARSAEGDKFVGKTVPDWDLLQSSGLETGIFKAETLEKNTVVFAHQLIPNTPGWQALIGEPAYTFDARWQGPIRTMILSSVVTILLAFTLGLTLVQRLLVPINNLAARSRLMVEQSKQGDLTETQQEVPPARIREFETLRISLNKAERELRGKLAEARAAAYEARENLTALERAESLARIGSWTLALDTGLFSFSPTMGRMNGVSPGGTLTVEDLKTFLSEADYARVGAAINRCFETREPYTVNVQHRHADREGFFPAEIRGSAVVNENDEIIALTGTVQDVTEREETRAQMAAIADSLPDGAIFCLEFTDTRVFDGPEPPDSSRLRYSYISAGAEFATGVSAEALMEDASRLMQQILPEDREHYREVAQRAMQRGEKFETVTRIGHPQTEKPRWLQIRAAPRPGEKSLIWDGIFLDVTDSYETREALREAKEAAEAAESAKSEFLATMSHEIRTPMNSVIGMTRLALQTSLDQKQRTYLEKINGSANVLLGIINDILDYSRIEAGGLLMEDSVFRLESVLESVSSVTALRAEEKGLEMTFSISSGTPAYWRGDSLRLSQVLTNLVGNAVKFTQSGDILVSVSALPEAGDGRRQLFFTVRDTGIGMSQEEIDRLFHPFTQAGADTARRYGGTGLGLAISRRIVELMGGRIWVESKPGEGSTFCFTVELGIVAPDAQPGSKAMLSAGLRDRRVLIVDDNDTARIALAEMIGDFGMDVISAASGDEALRLLRRADSRDEAFDIVLSDWRMPGMDGLELARKIREDARLENMPAVLMVTAYGHQLVMSEAESIGLQGVLLKPVTRSMVFNTVLDVLAIAPADGTGMTSGKLAVERIDESHALKATLGGREVLVVDDNALNREVAGEFLELVGIRVTTAADGREAIRKMEEKQFDAVLMDVHMPVMSGLEAIREIRKHPGWESLPVIALTAQARTEDQKASLDAGMSAHLTKPVDEQQLYRMLAGYLGSKAPAGQDPAPEAHEADQAAPEPEPEDGPFLASCERLLKRFGGNPARLLRFLNGFLRDFGQMDQRFDDLHSAGDLTELADFAHRVRGVVGYVEAEVLFTMAGKVETAARDGNSMAVNALAPPFTDRMRECLQVIKELIAGLSSATAPEAPGLSTIDALKLIDEIRPLISSGDFSARNGLISLAESLPEEEARKKASHILESFEDLDLDNAIRSLQDLRDLLAAGGKGEGS